MLTFAGLLPFAGLLTFARLLSFAGLLPFTFFQLTHQVLDLRAGHSQGSLFVSQDTLGRLLDVLAEVLDALPGCALVLCGFGNSIDAGESSGRIEGFLDLLGLGAAHRVVELAAEDRLTLFRLLAQFLEFF